MGTRNVNVTAVDITMARSDMITTATEKSCRLKTAMEGEISD
jgi:hypothetical protein